VSLKAEDPSPAGHPILGRRFVPHEPVPLRNSPRAGSHSPGPMEWIGQPRGGINCPRDSWGPHETLGPAKGLNPWERANRERRARPAGFRLVLFECRDVIVPLKALHSLQRLVPPNRRWHLALELSPGTAAWSPTDAWTAGKVQPGGTRGSSRGGRADEVGRGGPQEPGGQPDQEGRRCRRSSPLAPISSRRSYETSNAD
jgi:hypothetical protein